MTVNPTEKPELPWDPRDVKEVNLTIPITSTGQLVEVMKSLRPLYYFHQIPETWIEIKRNQNLSEEAEKNQKEMKIDMPESLEEVQSYLKSNSIDKDLIDIPITQHKQVKNTI
ncbi:hypothetical protein C2G38_2039428 [Gigaspora rosea]|uniref:Uncharacterized protein n=1 Tax=Gigaspora rosea TaxID=44941 RepID=A0A397UYQ2_9GLOM|nr:hypothetical protein C2G38_2039428 [Gigaspora rosea]